MSQFSLKTPRPGRIGETPPELPKFPSPGQNGEPGIYYWYYTGYCFWIYIQERYGESALTEILQELKKNENNHSLDFLKDIVNKVLNEDITEITKERFGVPSE